MDDDLKRLLDGMQQENAELGRRIARWKAPMHQALAPPSRRDHPLRRRNRRHALRYNPAPSMPKFYITTAIHYVNDDPHIGHMYENVVADVIARHRRRMGDDVWFLTGADEHGQKIERAAAKEGILPIELADRVVAKHHEMWRKLDISYDDFIRTTEERPPPRRARTDPAHSGADAGRHLPRRALPAGIARTKRRSSPRTRCATGKTKAAIRSR